MARERYLIHAGEEPINKPDAEKKPVTPQDKWSNFWFYHKWHVLIGLAVVLLGAFLIHDFTAKIDPDYQIGVVSKVMYSQDALDSMQKEFEKYAQDRNHDGRVVVQVNDYVINGDAKQVDPSLAAASMVKYTADLSDSTSILFLTDEDTFEKEQREQKVFAYLDGKTPPQNAADFSRMRAPLKNCKKLAVLEKQIPNGEGKYLLENLGISLRVNTLDSKDKQEYYRDSQKLLNAVLNG